jgi:flagellar biosynthetic protein FliR
MPPDALSAWVAACFLAGLRIAPVFAFAPPFTLVRVSTLARVLFGLGLAVSFVSGGWAAIPGDLSLAHPIPAAARELCVGIVVVLAFQIAFGALYFAGRTIDIQSGYGLALLIDPTTRSQTPLVGTLFALAAGGVFFALDGHLELLRALAASFRVVPLGTWQAPGSIGALTGFISIAFLTAFGVAGVVLLALFLVDVIIALMSRTISQMNVLILGLQVKAIVLLLVLPVSFGLTGALLARLMAATLNALPRLL